jgi:hypothetical protein
MEMHCRTKNVSIWESVGVEVGWWALSCCGNLFVDGHPILNTHIPLLYWNLFTLGCFPVRYT